MALSTIKITVRQHCVYFQIPLFVFMLFLCCHEVSVRHPGCVIWTVNVVHVLNYGNYFNCLWTRGILLKG